MPILPATLPVSVRVNGVNLLERYEFVTVYEGLEGREIPTLRQFIQDRVGRHGRDVYGVSYGFRTIRIRGDVYASSHTELISRLQALNRLCAPTDPSPASGYVRLGPTRLEFGDQPDRFYTGHFSDQPRFAWVGPSRHALVARFEATFQCSMPFALALADTAVGFNGLSDMSETYGDRWLQLEAGTAPCYPSIEMQMIGDRATPTVIVGNKALVVPLAGSLAYTDFLQVSRNATFSYVPNLVPDGDMEKPALTDWSVYAPGGEISILKWRDRVRYGRQCMRIVTIDCLISGGPYLVNAAAMTLSHATQYDVGCWVMAESDVAAGQVLIYLINDDTAGIAGSLYLPALLAGRWTYVSFTATYAGSTTYAARVYIAFGVGTPLSATFYVDDLHCWAATIPAFNGGMEAWSGAPLVPTGWTVDANAAVAQETTIKHSGTYSAKVTLSSGTMDGIVGPSAGGDGLDKFRMHGVWCYAPTANVGRVGMLRRLGAYVGNSFPCVYSNKRDQWAFLWSIYDDTGGSSMRLFIETPGDIGYFDDAVCLQPSLGATTSRTLWTFGDRGPALEVPFPECSLGFDAFVETDQMFPDDQLTFLIRFRLGYPSGQLPGDGKMRIFGVHRRKTFLGGLHLFLMDTTAGPILIAEKTTGGTDPTDDVTLLSSVVPTWAAGTTHTAVLTFGPRDGICLFWDGTRYGNNTSAVAKARIAVPGFPKPFLSSIQGVDAIEACCVFTRELDEREVGECSVPDWKPENDNQVLSYTGTFGSANVADNLIADCDLGLSYLQDMTSPAALTAVVEDNDARYPVILPSGTTLRTASEIDRVQVRYRKLYL